MQNVFREDIVILGAARTPVGRFDGLFKDVPATELGAEAIQGAVERAGIEPGSVQMVSMGVVVAAGMGEAPAKQALLKAGLPATTHSRTVDSVCGSALDAIVVSCESMVAGSLDLAVAGGMESRSAAPYLFGPHFTRNTANYKKGDRIKVKRAGAYRFALAENSDEQLSAAEMKDATAYDGLFWLTERKFMREYGLMFAKKMGYTVEQVNRYAAESHRKAHEARDKGFFDAEIVSVGEINRDELVSEEQQKHILEGSPDDIASGYNSSVPADAGAAVTLATASRAKALSAEPLAYVRGFARVDGPPEQFLVAPVHAVNALIEAMKAKGLPTDFTIIEANEAFGMQLPLFEESFQGMQVNIHGGAVAIGHPLGAAGARLLTTLLYAMNRYDHRLGLVAMCYAGGGAYALAVERA
ncbi:MAG: thiolase family protein [Armatimonadetes bacterium]|nr:thiolase family protein [Armatimonadota bacterium]